jgi:hypothetical protein
VVGVTVGTVGVAVGAGVAPMSAGGVLSPTTGGDVGVAERPCSEDSPERWTTVATPTASTPAESTATIACARTVRVHATTESCRIQTS